MYQSLLVKIDAHIATVTLNDPEKCNALGSAFWHEFPIVLEDLQKNHSIRVLILQGEGNHFCSGIDTNLLLKMAQLLNKRTGHIAYQLKVQIEKMQQTISLLEKMPFVVLAAIHGACIGAGLDLVCAVDCRYTTEDAYFSVAETRLGIVADLGTLQRLPQLLPLGLMKEFAFTGEKIPAEKMAQWGFVNTVYEDSSQLYEQVNKIATTIASHSPLVLAGIKESINRAKSLPPTDQLEYIATWQSAMLEPNEILQARIEKRPKFKNLDWTDLT